MHVGNVSQHPMGELNWPCPPECPDLGEEDVQARSHPRPFTPGVQWATQVCAELKMGTVPAWDTSW